MLPAIPPKYFLPLIGLAITAFIFCTSEFMPIALLSDIAVSFGMTPAETGIMITVYAWIVGLASLPLMLAVCRMEPRRLLLFTIALFAIGQIGSGLATSFAMLMGARVLVACAHAVFWSIATPLATRLVTRAHQPFALGSVITGTTVATIFGLPLGRIIGLALGWRMTFFAIALVTLAMLAYLWRLFPHIAAGDQSFRLRDLPWLLRNPVTVGAFLMSLLFATGYFTFYSYIEPYLGGVAGFSPAGITATLMGIGVAGFSGSVLFSRLYSGHRRLCLYLGTVGMAVLAAFYSPLAAVPAALVVLCMMLGSLSTLFNATIQAEVVAGTSRAAAPIAMSLFSGLFNVGIGLGTIFGGFVAGAGLLPFIGFAAAAILALPALYCWKVYLPAVEKK